MKTRDAVVQDAADRLRIWLVQTGRYTAGTFDLNDRLVAEIGKALADAEEVRP